MGRRCFLCTINHIVIGVICTNFVYITHFFQVKIINELIIFLGSSQSEARSFGRLRERPAAMDGGYQVPP